MDDRKKLVKSVERILKDNLDLKEQLEKANKSLIHVSELTKNYTSLDKELQQTRESVLTQQLKIDELLCDQEQNIRLIESVQSDKATLIVETERLKNLVHANQKEITSSLLKIADLEAKLENNQPTTQQHTVNLVSEIESLKRKLEQVESDAVKKVARIERIASPFLLQVDCVKKEVVEHVTKVLREQKLLTEKYKDMLGELHNGKLKCKFCSDKTSLFHLFHMDLEKMVKKDALAHLLINHWSSFCLGCQKQVPVTHFIKKTLARENCVLIMKGLIKPDIEQFLKQQ